VRAAWRAALPDPENPSGAGIRGGGGRWSAPTRGGRIKTTFPGGFRVISRDATSQTDWAMWWLWFPARKGGNPSVAGGPPRQALPKYIQPGRRAGTQLNS